VLFGTKCDFCQGRIAAADLEEGRAVLVLGFRYCASCMSQAIRKKTRNPSLFPPCDPKPARAAPAAPPAPAPASAPPRDRRTHERFRPPEGAELVLRARGGLGRLLGVNLVKKWVDVSLGGLGAVITRRIREGETLDARISYKPLGDAFDVVVVARHVRQQDGLPSVGFEFENPCGRLRVFLTRAQDGFKSCPAHDSPAAV
jgi:hypothetical protein